MAGQTNFGHEVSGAVESKGVVLDGGKGHGGGNKACDGAAHDMGLGALENSDCRRIGGRDRHSGEVCSDCGSDVLCHGDSGGGVGGIFLAEQKRAVGEHHLPVSLGGIRDIINQHNRRFYLVGKANHAVGNRTHAQPDIGVEGKQIGKRHLPVGGIKFFKQVGRTRSSFG